MHHANSWVAVTALTLCAAAACGGDDPPASPGGVGAATGTGGQSSSAGASGGAGGAGAAPVAATDEDLLFLRGIAAVRKVEGEHPEIWPGYAFSSSALLGVDRDRRALALQHEPPLAGAPLLDGVPAEIGPLLGEVRVAIGQENALQEGQSFQIGSYQGADRFEMAYPFGKHIGQPLPPDVDEMLTATIAAHEVFHLYQGAWQTPYSDDACGFPLDDETLGLGFLEQIALAEALDSGDATAGLTELSVLRHTRSAAQPTIRDTEDYWDAVEGTAKLVECEYGAAAGYTPATDVVLAALLVPSEPDIAGFGRNRHYETGAAIARLLDLNGTPYRQQLAGGARLSEIAAAAVGIDAEAAQAALPALLAKYQYETEVLPQVVEARDAYEASWDAALQALEPAAGRLVTLDFDGAALKSLAMADSREFEDCSEVYVGAAVFWDGPTLTATITDQTVRASGMFETWEFRSQETGELVVDGTAQAFANGAYSFQELEIALTGWAVHATAPGTLTVSDTDIHIVLAR
jgi:hypothetical protein